MRLIIRSGSPRAIDEWREKFKIHAPALDVVDWHDDIDPATVDYAPVSYTHLTLPTICSV